MSDFASSSAALVKVAHRARQLYSLPGVALQIMELMRSPNLDLDELKRCIETDPALVGKILRAVNSSLFGVSKPVTKVQQAIALLGVQRLKILVLGFSLPVPTAATIQPAILDRYWRHTLLKSITARELAESNWKTSGDEPFVAGLLQDIGMLALAQDLGEPYLKFLKGVWTAGNVPREFEGDVLGFDHVELSVRLMEDWHLPPNFLRAVGAKPHAAEMDAWDPEARQLARILHLAESVTCFVFYRDARWLDEVLKVGQDLIGLTVEQLHELLLRIEQKAPELATALNVPWHDETKYANLIEEAQQRQRVAVQAVMSSECVDGSDEAVPANSVLPRMPLPSSRGTHREELPPFDRHSGGGTATALAPPRSARAAPVIVETLSQKLQTVIGQCRQSRQPVTLALVQLDESDRVQLRFGPQGVPEFMENLGSLIRRAVDEDQGSTTQISESRIAVILTGMDRSGAIRVGRDMLQNVRNWSDAVGENISVSVGLASLNLPPRNFPGGELIQAAERCLQGVLLSGGDGVKSIEMC